MGIIATDHGAGSMKARLKTPKKGADKHALEAWNKGLPREETGGDLRVFIDRKYSNSNSDRGIKVWRNFIWFFGIDGGLVTCFPLPGRFSGQVRIQAEKWEKRKSELTQECK
jgi:hypothetical protein